MVPTTSAAGSAGGRRRGGGAEPTTPSPLPLLSARRPHQPSTLPEVPGPAEPALSPLTDSPDRATRSRNGSAGRGRPLTRLGQPSAAPKFPETSLAARVSRWNPRGLAGAPLSGSAFSLFQMDGSRINSLLPLKKRKKE